MKERYGFSSNTKLLKKARSFGDFENFFVLSFQLVLLPQEISNFPKLYKFTFKSKANFTDTKKFLQLIMGFFVSALRRVNY